MNIRQGVDYTSRDYEGFRTDMIELLKEKIPTYSDFSSSDAGVVLIELLAHGLDILSYYTDKVANEVFPDTAVERESVIKHCRRLGYELRNSVPSRYIQVFKILPQDTDFILPRGFKLETKGDDKVEFELIEDLIIPKGSTGVEKDSSGKYLHTVLIEEGYSINRDIIGSSNGNAYQEFYLTYTPIIVDSLKVYVQDSHNLTEYTKVTNFIDSTSTSKVFSVEISENNLAKIMFGSGTSGSIPPIYDSGISANYRVGGGVKGNVALDYIVEMPQKPSVVVETFNIGQVQKGMDKEEVEEARINAPSSLKTLWRAVSLLDYENLLKQEFRTEISKVKAIAESDKCTVSVYILLHDTDKVPKEYVDRYLEFYDERKEIGYTIKILPPIFRDLTVNVNITTSTSYSNEEMKAIVESSILNDDELTNLDFGVDIITSKIIHNVMSLAGVRDASATKEGGEHIVSSNSITRIKTLNIVVRGGI